MVSVTTKTKECVLVLIAVFSFTISFSLVAVLFINNPSDDNHEIHEYIDIGSSEKNLTINVSAKQENYVDRDELLFLSPMIMEWDGPQSFQFRARQQEICKIMYINYNLNILQKTKYLTKNSKPNQHISTFEKFVAIYNELMHINNTFDEDRKNNLIIMMYDGFDVYFEVNYKSLLNKYLDLVNDHNITDSILINAELNCAIDSVSNGKDMACRKMNKLASLNKNHPQTQNKYISKYLNTGVYIARFRILLGFYHKLYHEFLPIFKSKYNNKKINDQTLFIMYFIYLYDNNLNYNILIPDYSSNFIQTFHQQVVNMKKQNIDSDTIFAFKNVTNKMLLYNKITNTFPVVLHFNGQGRELMTQYMDYKITQNSNNWSDWNNTNFTYNTNEGDIEWRKLCSYLQQHPPHK